jgi:hypothetical protein
MASAPSQLMNAAPTGYYNNPMYVPFVMPNGGMGMAGMSPGDYYQADLYGQGGYGYKGGNSRPGGKTRYTAAKNMGKKGGDVVLPVEQSQDDEYLLTNALFLAKDQAGCRRLQRRLEADDAEGSFRRRLFERISENFDELMVDPFGNYLCQKVIESADEAELEQIFHVIGLKILEIAFDCHGTRALQKLIELVKESGLIKIIVGQLNGHVIQLVQDNNGNHVIQKCLNYFPHEYNQFIYDEIRQDVIDVATHKHGCCVIQRCLDHSSTTQLQDLVNVIVYNTLDLVQDQYGNYVVQYVLDLDEFQQQKETIASSLVPNPKDRRTSD